MSDPGDFRVLEVVVVGPFGRELIRPKNEVAHAFCKLLKQRTLTRDDIQSIKALGYVVRATHKESEEL